MKDTVDPEWNHEEVINIKEAGDNQIDIRLFDKVNDRTVSTGLITVLQRCVITIYRSIQIDYK